MIQIVGGPFNGRDLPHVERAVNVTGLPAPEFLCSRNGAGEWQHHVLDGEQYRWVGPCSGVDHDGRDPDNYEECKKK